MKTKNWILFGGRVVVTRSTGAPWRLRVPSISYVPCLGLTLSLFARSITFTSAGGRALTAKCR